MKVKKEFKVGSATPWGPAQTVTVFASGIVFVSTASHGGIHLSEERMMMLPDIPKKWIDGPWFEEDCDISIPILAFRLWETPEWKAEGWRIEGAESAAIASVRLNHGDEMAAALMKAGQE